MSFLEKQVHDVSKNCEICILAKQTRLPFDNNRSRAVRPLELIHSDVAGPIDPPTWDGKNYYVTFRDDYTNFTQTYLIEAKSEVEDIFKEYVAEVEAK